MPHASGSLPFPDAGAQPSLCMHAPYGLGKPLSYAPYQAPASGPPLQDAANQGRQH